MAIAFRASLGKAVCYDNLGMHEHTQKAIDQLQDIVSHVDCNDCIEHRPCSGTIVPISNKFHRNRPMQVVENQFLRDRILHCKNKKDKQEKPQDQNQGSYGDIIGPDKLPEPGWCEEMVTGVERAMDAIACLAPTYAVKIVLIGIIEGLITRGLKCCKTGDFWKACVAPITRKWEAWKNFRNRNVFPNEQNLPFYRGSS